MGTGVIPVPRGDASTTNRREREERRKEERINNGLSD
jgi:hypothetical protein